MSAGTVGIVGLGLMGGSLARELAAGGWTVLGADRDPDTLETARAEGVVAGPLDFKKADLVILAVPVGAGGEWIRRLARELGPTAVVTDVGSTKRSVVAEAEAAGLGPRFVGSHPVAGHHSSGWAAGREGLYRETTVWLCPAEGATGEAVDRVSELWRTVGAEPRLTEAPTHDRLLARASHLPQVLATVLAATLAREGVTGRELGPGGHDMTRLAGSDPTLWTDVFLDNADEVGAALGALSEELERMTRAIHDADEATVRSILAAGLAWSLDGNEPMAGAANV